MNEKFVDKLKNASIHSLTSILYILFVVPFDLWKKAIKNLAKQYMDGSLRVSDITGAWPFLTFIKNFITKFYFDFFTFASYFVGLLIAIRAFFEASDYLSVGARLSTFVVTLIVTYYSTIGVALMRDLVQLILMPIYKLMNWLKKPAQYYDLNVKKEEITK